jgi:predicted ester cyclase
MKKYFLLLVGLLVLVSMTASAESLSKAERNKQAVIEFFHLENQHKPVSEIEKMFDKNAVIESLDSLITIQQALALWDVAFPDRNTKIMNLIAQNNYVFADTVTTGTQTGIFWGIAPTNKKIREVSYDIFTFNEAGKIIQFSQQWNELEVMKQLGYIVL